MKVKDLLQKFFGIKIWIYKNDSAKNNPATKLYCGDKSGIPEEFLQFDVADWECNEGGVNIYVKYDICGEEYNDNKTTRRSKAAQE